MTADPRLKQRAKSKAQDIRVAMTPDPASVAGDEDGALGGGPNASAGDPLLLIGFRTLAEQLRAIREKLNSDCASARVDERSYHHRARVLRQLKERVEAAHPAPGPVA